jgi:hypothetical protein
MNVSFETRSKEVAGGRLASSAQPPRATSFLTHTRSRQLKPQPIPSASFLEARARFWRASGAQRLTARAGSSISLPEQH